MVDRICISINNRCNLACKYCHFHEKKAHIQERDMDVFKILDNVMKSIDANDIELFKIGFVGNGETLLNYSELKEYVTYISDYIHNGKIAVYVVTNGLLVNKVMLEFFKTYNVNLGFSIDGIASIHNKYRCRTHSKVVEKFELFKHVFGHYPSMNCTVGRETLEHVDETIAFFEKFNTRITFSRMIGTYGIAPEDFNQFMEIASKRLHIRRGGYDCTMYGGLCGAGMNNFFFANGYAYVCGNCIDLPTLGKSDRPLEELGKMNLTFDRTCCYKETLCE